LQIFYIRTIGGTHLQYSNVFLSDPNLSHWAVFIGIGFVSVLTTFGALRANEILDSRFVNITSYLQVPILYAVDVLWFENGLPKLFEILGSALFFTVLVVKSLLEPLLISKISIESPDEERKLLPKSVRFEDYNENKQEHPQKRNVKKYGTI